MINAWLEQLNTQLSQISQQQLLHNKVYRGISNKPSQNFLKPCAYHLKTFIFRIKHQRHLNEVPSWDYSNA